MFRAHHQLIRYVTVALLPLAPLACGNDTASSTASTETQGLLSATQLDTTDGTPATIALTADTTWCVDIAGNGSQNGTAVGLYPCNGTDAQSFTFAGNLIYASNNRCLNVKDGKTSNGAKLQIYACNSSDINNQFTVSGAHIVWKGNGECLDLKGGSRKNFAPLQLYSCNTSNNNQSWTIANSATTTTTTSGSSSSTGSTTVTSSATDVAGSPVTNLTRIPWSQFHHVTMSRGQVNNEQEAYVDDGSTISINSSNQLVLKAYVASNNNGATGRSTKWKSGRVTSRNIGAKKGYIEARMKLPSAAGTWPAFWVMPGDNKPTWPQGGEIDIMEQVDGNDQQNVSTHYGSSPSATKNTHLAVTLKNMSNTWHTYGLAFDTTHCAFYVDGKKVQSVKYPSDSPFAKDMPNYGIILNLAMGGNWPKAAEPSIGAQYVVTDYVAQSANVPSDF